MFDSTMHPWELISNDGYGLDFLVSARASGQLRSHTDGLLLRNWEFWNKLRALEWVFKQVKYFGGHRANVTLGGVSTGTLGLESN